MTWEQDSIKALEEHIEKDKAVSHTLYDTAFFQSHMKYRPIYSFIADLMVAHLKLGSVIDWGCGCGFLLERLHGHGIIELMGIDGSKEVMEFWKKELPPGLVRKLVVGDIFDYGVEDQYDLAVCMEVGEHVKEKDAGLLVYKICNSSTKWIWWTAAQPGQGGTNHVNCQPISYWEDAFAEESDFRPDWEKTYEIKQAMLVNHSLCLGFPWFRDNLCLFSLK
ncbi:MAG: class I SAM-dependent methyltransferase [Gammaproteobacteria bacterium]|nr:class I SAM-dependent methyltransferase [Gammaproteobacteria bacterium]